MKPIEIGVVVILAAAALAPHYYWHYNTSRPTRPEPAASAPGAVPDNRQPLALDDFEENRNQILKEHYAEVMRVELGLRLQQELHRATNSPNLVNVVNQLRALEEYRDGLEKTLAAKASQHDLSASAAAAQPTPPAPRGKPIYVKYVNGKRILLTHTSATD